MMLTSNGTTESHKESQIRPLTIDITVSKDSTGDI